MAVKLPIIGTDDLIVSAAFRYALGRQSYMVGHVVSWIRKNRNRIGDGTCDLIVREIHEAADKNRIGADMDRREWIGLAAALEPNAQRFRKVSAA